MNDRKGQITRRETLGMALGAGSCLALSPGGLWAGEAERRDEPSIVTKPIPATGERLPVIGIGTARRYDIAASEAQLAPLAEVVRNFTHLGGKLIDTAPSYGNAEPVVGNLVLQAGNRGQIFLATKVGRGRDGVQAGRAEMEQSLKRLRVDKVDLMQVHNLAGVAAMLPVLRDWKDAGKTRYIGVTTSSKDQYPELERVLRKERLDFIEVDYAIDNREVEQRILPLAQERGVAVLAALPFGRGRVFDAFAEQPVPDWAQALEIRTWAQFALKYIVSHPGVTVAIPGTAKMEYLTDNFGAARGPTPDAATRRRMAAVVDGS
ncbi:MAG: aldo/keto reductase [Pseudomonadota bacterium]|nr:aldo/keto reductase [Pseudomonadota bacterium]